MSPRFSAKWFNLRINFKHMPKTAHALYTCTKSSLELSPYVLGFRIRFPGWMQIWATSWMGNLWPFRCYSAECLMIIPRATADGSQSPSTSGVATAPLSLSVLLIELVLNLPFSGERIHSFHQFLKEIHDPIKAENGWTWKSYAISIWPSLLWPFSSP